MLTKFFRRNIYIYINYQSNHCNFDVIIEYLRKIWLKCIIWISINTFIRTLNK